MKLIQRSNKGRGLESAVIASQTLVTVEKMGHAVKYLAGGKMIAQRGPVDFIGVVNGTGRAIVFDAKVCENKTRFPIGNVTHFPAHQRESLIRFGKAGAVAGLLVECLEGAAFLWMDWRVIEVTQEASLEWGDPFWLGLGDNKHAIKFDRIPGVRSET